MYKFPSKFTSYLQNILGNGFPNIILSQCDTTLQVSYRVSQKKGPPTLNLNISATIHPTEMVQYLKRSYGCHLSYEISLSILGCS